MIKNVTNNLIWQRFKNWLISDSNLFLIRQIEVRQTNKKILMTKLLIETDLFLNSCYLLSLQ